MPRLLIYGDGGFGRELLLPLRMLEPSQLPGELTFLDDESDSVAHAGVPVIRFEEAAAGDRYLIAIADSRVRERLHEKCLAAGLVPWTLVASDARIGPGVEMGEGCIFYLQAVVSGFCRIGSQFHLSLQSYVGHDCVIGDYVTFGPSVGCCGNVHIGDHAYIGAGAVIRNGAPDKPLIIGKAAVVGMGAIVTKDVPPHTTVIGNPARVKDYGGRIA
ncbi:MAG TPA: acetyltransferase [Allosphingosinicella sp.]